MNKGLMFSGGALLGSVVGFIIGYRKAFKDFEEGMENSEPPKHIPEEYLREHFENSLNDAEDDEKEITSREDLDKIKEKLTSNWNGTTNYAAAYDLSRNEDSELGGSELHNEEALGGMDEETANFLKEREGKAPKIISETAASGLPAGIDHQCMFYWQYDDTLTTEDDEEIEDVERFLGDALTKYGFSDNEEKTIYVINYELGTVYEIEKIEKAFHTDN